ncbi:hypothetical protein V8C42DRAFT_10111 [Trichoderma barbatum]
MEWPRTAKRLYTNTTACFVLVRGFPMDTQSYGLFISISFVLKLGLGAMNGFSFLVRLFKRQISFKGDLYYHQCTRGGDTETRGIFPSRDTQRYHFGRVASKQERRGGEG